MERQRQLLQASRFPLPHLRIHPPHTFTANYRTSLRLLVLQGLQHIIVLDPEMLELFYRPRMCILDGISQPFFSLMVMTDSSSI
jgi:hypothetical protein